MTIATLTVFTPTYNRAHTLPRLFESLNAQTSRDFTWLIVDDGSIDRTRELVQCWQADAPFTIDYIYQENRGKHNAHNAAVAHAQTELLAVVDSDDELLPDAVRTIVEEWRRLNAQERGRIVGVWTLCTLADGKLLGGPLPAPVIDASLQELRYLHDDYRDMTPCFTTAILRRYLFPATPPGACSFIPEDYVWMRITRTQKVRFVNIATRKVDYQASGLSARGRQMYRMSRSLSYGYFGHLENELEWFWYRPTAFLLSAVQAARYGLFSGQFRQLLRTLRWRARLLVLVAVPVAAILLCRDRASGRIANELRTA